MVKFTTGTGLRPKYGKIAKKRRKSHKIGQKHQKPPGNSRHFTLY